VDATTRRWEETEEEGLQSKLLLADKAEWSANVDRLLQLVDGLAVGRSRIRVAVLAFADEAYAVDAPRELAPRFLLYPPDVGSRQLVSRDPEAVARLLSRLPESNGADYVDALGEGLAAACELSWSPTARKVLLLLVDSPGYSVIAPAPWGADARVRTVDVDTEVARLHRRGVEVVTVFAGPPAELGLYDPGRPTALLLHHAREQYQRLASTPDYAAELEGLDPDALAANLTATSGPLARGATWPCFVGSEEISPEAARSLGV
jgi:hypothetical protein